MKKVSLIIIIFALLSCNKSNDLTKYIGMNFNSSEVNHFTKSMGDPEIYNCTTHISYSFKKSGIEIVVNENNVIESIEIEDKYNGSIPFALNFADNRKSVIDKFGEPNKKHQGNTSIYGKNGSLDAYDIKGITIGYVSVDTLDMNSKISGILFYKPK